MPKAISVGELTREIKHLLEGNLPYLQVEGEISNYKPHYSGHAYFVLKDETAQLSAVMWRSSVERSAFDFLDGKKVRCSGRISLYEKSGRYQLVVDSVEEAGRGDLHLKFEALKKDLDAKGYFLADLKKPLPKYPRRIGIVTSPTGAALQDMLSVANRRNAATELILREAKVQGIGAAKEIAAGITELNEFAELDLIIVGRGGGSLEDLWAFNEEIVADAIYKSKIPIVSAVGHEIDFSISDFCADLRAPTPSAAMELVIPDRNELLGQLAYMDERIATLTKAKLNTARERLAAYAAHYALKSPELLTKEKRKNLNLLSEKVQEKRMLFLASRQEHLNKLKELLNALSPQQVLERGYAIVKQNDTYIDSKKKLADGLTELLFKDGALSAKIKREN
jgi:exodeoxyribonuclease VII large subunit